MYWIMKSCIRNILKNSPGFPGLPLRRNGYQTTYANLQQTPPVAQGDSVTAGQIIGTVGLNNIVRGCFHSCFLGYKLDQDFLNRGYMTEAVRAAVDYAFGPLALHRVEANIMPHNQASLRVAEKCGFLLYERRVRVGRRLTGMPGEAYAYFRKY